jgi:hypothetical protein
MGDRDGREGRRAISRPALSGGGSARSPDQPGQSGAAQGQAAASGSGARSDRPRTTRTASAQSMPLREAPSIVPVTIEYATSGGLGSERTGERAARFSVLSRYWPGSASNSPTPARRQPLRPVHRASGRARDSATADGPHHGGRPSACGNQHQAYQGSAHHRHLPRSAGRAAPCQHRMCSNVAARTRAGHGSRVRPVDPVWRRSMSRAIDAKGAGARVLSHRALSSSAERQRTGASGTAGA